MTEQTQRTINVNDLSEPEEYKKVTGELEYIVHEQLYPESRGTMPHYFSTRETADHFVRTGEKVKFWELHKHKDVPTASAPAGLETLEGIDLTETEVAEVSWEELKARYAEESAKRAEAKNDALVALRARKTLTVEQMEQLEMVFEGLKGNIMNLAGVLGEYIHLHQMGGQTLSSEMAKLKSAVDRYGKTV